MYVGDTNSPQVYMYNDMQHLLGKTLNLPRQAVQVRRYGSVHSKIILLAESYRISGKLTLKCLKHSFNQKVFNEYCIPKLFLVAVIYSKHILKPHLIF